MAQVKLSVGNRSYDLACPDGQEPRLEMLAGMLDSKAREAEQVVGSANEARQLLLAGLLLADELTDERGGVVHVAHHDGLLGAHRDARRLKIGRAHV